MALPRCWVIGFPRTGTASACAALRVLGWDPIHNPRSLDELAAHDSGGDLLVAAHWRDLLAAYRHSRFILTTRHVEGWMKSLRRIPKFWASGEPFDRAYRRILYGTDRLGDQAALRRAWRDHHEAVRAVVPADRLLVLAQPFAWAPLLRFLDRPPPGVDFPWRNRGSVCDVGRV